MTQLLKTLSPNATNMIRMDHSHVIVTFHRYKAETSTATKKAIVETICTALEIHAELEEEIFYPAVRKLMPDDEVMRNSIPEHDEMRRLIGELRQLEPGTYAYDDKLYELMREVMHHVADEETVLLPAAERSLAGRLDELGVEMTRRRLQLAAPQAGKIGFNMARAMPGLSVFMLGALIGLGAWAARTPRHR
jgi:hemerythrin superfamily protein